MGKKKRGHPDVEEILSRPWCYYCERDFDDLKILINHQKAKHFKCERCGRRLNTAGGLSVHMTQVHKETLTIIENALPNRSGANDIEIFGMEGIPEEIAQSHNQRVLQQFAQAEADRRAATGNPGPGTSVGGAAKKPKFESPNDLKKRLAEHKAKKAAEEATGISSGNNTPSGLGNSTQSPGAFGGSGSPSYPQQQLPFGGPPNNSTYSSTPQPYGQQPPPFQQQQQQQQPPYIPQLQPGFSPPGMPQFPNHQAFAPPQQFQPPVGQGFPPQYQNGPPQFQNGPPHFQNGPPQFQNGPPQYQNGPPSQFQGGPPQFQNGPQQPYGAGSPPPLSPSPFQQNQYQPPRHHTPPQPVGMAQRPGSLPPAPGLPQRPSFGVPSVNAFQLQQMHQGQLGGPPNSTDHSYNSQQNAQEPSGHNGGPGGVPNLKAPVPSPLLEPPSVLSANATSLDDLLSGAAKDADKAATTAEVKSELKGAERQEEKKGKKEKDKSMKLIYSDNEISPEEKMAQLPRYAFVPSG